ncbi:MAG TPA: GntR family transcriptional regulator [Nitrolancea sp.]|jgi:DNA-binding GntR family transcriptional regulator|nr:GntR family transcriptional regulator [Nitrolancea sp.]
MRRRSTATNGNAEETPPDPQLRGLAEYAATQPTGPSSSQQAYDTILGAILNRKVQSGQRLAEIPVAKAINLGRTPVREALMRLEADGFVTSEPRVGLVVASNTLETISEIYELREVLESFAARLAARYARPSDIFAIEQIYNESVGLTEKHDTLQLRLLNTRFHQAINAAARNDQLTRTLRQLVNRLRLSPVSIFDAPGRAEEILQEHRALLDAIIARDEELAARLAAEHQRRDKDTRLAQMASEIVNATS